MYEPRTALHPDAYSDLFSVRYKRHGRSVVEGLDCWGLVLEMYRRRGIEIPSAEGAHVAQRAAVCASQPWTKLEAPSLGCLAAMRSDATDPNGATQHAGIYIGDGCVLHSCVLSGVIVSRVCDLSVTGYYEWNGRAEMMPVAPDDSVLVVEYDKMLNRGVRLVPWRDALQIAELVPDDWHVADDRDFRRGGMLIVSEQPMGGQLLFIALLIFVVFNAMASVIMRMFGPQPNISAVDDKGSGYFDLSGLRNTSGLGYVQQITYGQMRVAGHILSAFQRSDANNNTKLSLLLGLGLGPFQEIGAGGTTDISTTGSIPSDIQIDGNPAAQFSGSRMSRRLGTNNQGAIPGFNEIVATVSYNNTLTSSETFTHVTTTTISAYEINFAFPSGLFEQQSNGNIIGSTVTHEVRHRLKGSTAPMPTTPSAVLRTPAVGNYLKRTAFLDTLRVADVGGVPLVRGEYDIEIKRTTTYPSSNAGIINQSLLFGVNEIQYDEIAHTGRALLALTVVNQDQLSGAIPNITCIVKGRKVWVWMTGSWSESGTGHTWSATATPQQIYTDNPAWCVLDLLLNEQYGMGRNGRMTLANIHLASFVEWAQNCDALVSDGRGGTIRRARFAGSIDKAHNGWDYAQKAAGSHWARLMLVGNKVRVITEKTATPIYSFGAGNVRDVAYVYTGRATRANVFEVQYLNAENNHEVDWAQKLDEAAIVTSGEAIVKDSAQAIGVTRPAQAYRLAQWRMNYSKLSTRQLQFTAGPESLHLLPGDVIYFSHDAMSSEAGGRILAATSTTVRIDKAIVASGGTGRINCRTTGDTFEERTLTNGTYARGAVITITSAWTSIPVAGAPYLAGATTTYRQQFRITAIDTEPELSRKISCTQHADTIYSDDPGTVETFTEDMPDPRLRPALPTGVSAHYEQTLGAGADAENYLRVEWIPAESWNSVDVWLRAPDDTDAEWEFRGRYKGQQALLCGGVRPSTGYAVSVVPVNARGGVLGGPENGAITYCYTRGRTHAPTTPTVLRCESTAQSVDATVSAVTDATAYDWRYGSTWAGSMRLAKTLDARLQLSLPFYGRDTVMCRSVSSTGTRSVASATFPSVTPKTCPSLWQLDLNSEEHSLGFPGPKTNIIVSAGEVILSGADTGTYESLDLVPYLDGQVSSLRIRAKCGLRDTARTWDNCLFQWGSTPASATWATSYLDGAELKENLTWAEAGCAWNSFGGLLYLWSGPKDVDALLEPAIHADIDGAGYTAFLNASDNELGTVVAKVTLNRPHSDYVPVIKELQVCTLHYSMSEPERIVFEFFATSATGTTGQVYGHVSTTNAGATLKVPTGKILTVLACNAVVTTGATPGTYTVSAIVRNITGAANVIVATAATTSVSTRLPINAEGTRIAPLATLAAGNEYQIGWFNAGSSPGALTSTTHFVQLTCIMETA